MASPQIFEAGTGVAGRLAEARRLTDEVFEIVRPEALYDRPIPERHRLIFYLGHLEAFDWNLLGGEAGAGESRNRELDRLFAFGIDPVDGGLPNDQPEDWPRASEVQEYRMGVRRQVDRMVNGADRLLLEVAIEHRLMHAETLAYLLHQLPLDRKICRESGAEGNFAPFERASVLIPAGSATIGQKRLKGGFGWDNEFEETRVAVPEFRADVYPVTNADFLEFVRAGGYDERALWTEDDWAWRQEAGPAHPLIRAGCKYSPHPNFWRRDGGGWQLRTMFAQIALPADWPVFVSHAEAAAYARWADKKLPTEAQWHRMAYGTPEGEERAFPWGDEAPTRERGNFDFASWDATAVQAHSLGRSGFGVMDLAGNGWEWTSTVFGPLPGFEPFSFYAGYSADFFDGKHYVMKGGSPRTAACLLRRSFRNWFQPHYPHIYSKFRCVQE